MLNPPRQLAEAEIESLLALPVPARLATLDSHGFPHVTPLWFLWRDGSFYMTSIADRPHCRRLRRNARAGLCIDIEEAERLDGQRPNRQVRAIGQAELFTDHEGTWTRMITAKYLIGPGAPDQADARARQERLVIVLRPERLVAAASV